MKSFLWTLVLTLVTVNLTRCQTLKGIFGDGRPHAIYLFDKSMRESEKFPRPLEVAPNKFIYLPLKPAITSKDIEKIEVIALPNDRRSLRLNLDGHGKMVWTQITARMRGKKLIVLFDHEYRGYITVPDIDDRGIIILPGPYGKEEVEKIVDNAEKNRRR